MCKQRIMTRDPGVTRPDLLIQLREFDQLREQRHERSPKVAAGNHAESLNHRVQLLGIKRALEF